MSKNSEVILIDYQLPFDFETLLAYMRAHQIHGVESIDDVSYERVFKDGTKVAWVRVTNLDKKSKLRVEVRGSKRAAGDALKRITTMFDVGLDPKLVQTCFNKNIHFKKLWKKYPGLRIPKSWDPFEALITTVLGQLVSMEQAGRLIFQLIQASGKKVRHPVTGEVAFLFPDAEAVASSTLEEVRTTGARRRTLLTMSAAVAAGEIDVDLDQDPELFKQNLLALPGIGPWSAEYMTLRALGATDCFPGTDLILKRAVDAHADMEIETLRPFRSYGALYIWKEHAKALSKKPSAAKPKS